MIGADRERSFSRSWARHDRRSIARDFDVSGAPGARFNELAGLVSKALIERDELVTIGMDPLAEVVGWRLSPLGLKGHRRCILPNGNSTEGLTPLRSENTDKSGS